MSLPFQVDAWEERAKSCLSTKIRWSLSDVERLVREGESLSGGLPSLSVLREALRKSKEWLARARAIKQPSQSQAAAQQAANNDSTFPYLETLESLVARGRPLPVKLDLLPNLETQV
jgi:histone demethylase JARID1